MLSDLMQKNDKLVIGLMSGTSADGVDAVLVRIQGHGLSTTIRQLAFVSPAYPAEVHDRIIRVAKGDFGGAKELCLLNFYLSELFVDACLELCEKAGVDVSDIDLIGTHGQTVYHIPEAEMYLGKPIRATLQIGDPSLLCEKIGGDLHDCPHAGGVLRCEGGYCAHGVNAVCGHCFDVGLYACTAAAVAARYCQCCFHRLLLCK